MPDDLHLDVAVDRGGFCLRVAQTLPGGAVTAISGPSGSGKTTLLRVVAGLEGPESGTVRLGDRIWQGPGQGRRGFVPAHRRRIGMVFQEPRLFPHLDVRRNLSFGARRAGLDAGALAPFVAALDIGPLLDRPVRGLSGGEQRRVALARTLAMRPCLLCLDEPLTGLDRDRRDELLPYLARAVGEAGCPALYVSHDPDEIVALADMVLPLRDGRIAGGGLRPVPDCLDLPVLASDDRTATLDLGGTPVTVPGRATAGGVRRLHVPRASVLVSLDPPGRTGAALTVEARYDGRSPEDGAPVFRVGPYRIAAARLPGGVAEADLTARPLWLMALEVRLTPERGG